MATQQSPQHITAHLRHLRMSPRKVRLVADLVRGMDVPSALVQLKYQPRAASAPIMKLVQSAVANAQDRFDLKPEALTIEMIRVNEGATLKRFRPRAYGRAGQILKRTSHIELALSSSVPLKAKQQATAPGTEASTSKSASRKSTAKKKSAPSTKKGATNTENTKK